jgi:ribosome-associated heat shock protein Hsp15
MEDKLRIDKWLWAARFYKTRALAVEEITKGRVLVNDLPAKPAREVGLGDRVTVRKHYPPIEVIVRGISRVRGPAPVAAKLFEETEESVIRRETAAEMRRLAPEPSLEYDEGRPTKRDRRVLAAIRGK